MIDPKFWEDVMCSGWVDDTLPDGEIPNHVCDFTWDERYKLKDGAPDSVKEGFAELKEIHKWQCENKGEKIIKIF